MTQDEIIEMAREAGLDWDIGWVLNVELPNRFETFANLVAAKEREALAQPEQEPVAWADHGVVNWIADKQFKHASLLYTAPPQRTWVGLTDEEIEQIGLSNYIKVVRETEAKLKERNT